MNAEDIFHQALAKPSAERVHFLAGACAGDEALQRRIEALLKAHENPGSFLAGRPGAPLATVDEPIAERPGTVIGPYKLMEQIGEGGMGLVFVAEQQQPVRRKVALKVIKPGMDTRHVVARFEAERQALALMDHPNIAKVFDGGQTASGRPYFVMELVKGMPITEYCDKNQLAPRERLNLFLNVCQAVQHAHQKGIIHRDLKPSNMLVASHDGTPVVKVIDFGVAKAVGQQLTEKTIYTQFVQMVGTPLYMSPEQAGQSDLDVDTRSDIYSLGVLLYELLTGTTPFDKGRLKEADYDEIRRIIREEEPPKPSTRISTLGQAVSTVSTNRQCDPHKLKQIFRGELDWIVMKALEKDRNRRYETASALAADVQRYLADEPVLACPPSAWYRFRKLARRKRRAMVTGSVFVVAALVGVGALGVSTVLVWKANKELKESVERERRAVERERREAYFQRITVAHRELSMDNLAAALRALDDCPEDLREWEWHYLMRLCKTEPLVILDQAEVSGVSFSRPGGEWLASAGGDGTVKIRNSRTGDVVQSFQAHSGAVVSVVFHPDGRHLASRGADGKVKVWDLMATGQAMFTEPCNDDVRKFGSAYTIAFSPDGRLLAAGTDEVVRVWDWKNRQILCDLRGHNYHTIAVTFSGDGRLATGGFPEPLKIWNPATGELLRTIHAHAQPVSALAFSKDGKWLASASFDRTVKLADSTTGERLRSFSLHTGNVECVAISPNGRLLASAGEDKTVRVWDAMAGREVLGLYGHTERCSCVAFSPDGLRIASASSDKTIRIWDGTPLRGDERGRETLTFREHSDEIRSVAVSPTDQRIVSAGEGMLVKVWDGQPDGVSAEFSGHEEFSGMRGVIFCVAWHPKGRLIASAGLDTVRVWDARTKREVFRLPAAQGKIALPYQSVTFSPDGRYLVTGKGDGAVQIWDGEAGQEVGTLDRHNREIRGVVFSRDGEYLATASSDGIVKLWDAKLLDKQQLYGKAKPRIPPIQARVAGPGLSVAFSPDGQRLATGGENNTVKIWDVQNGRLLRTLEGHKGDVYTVAFSPDPDGRWIASAGEDSAVKVWDSYTGTLVRSFRGHLGLVSSVAFSRDGGLLVSGSRDHTVKVWDVTHLEAVPDR